MNLLRRLVTMFWRLSSLIWRNEAGLAAPSRLPETHAPRDGVIARIILAAALAWSRRPMRLPRSVVTVYWRWTLTPTHCDPPLLEICCWTKTAWHGLATSPDLATNPIWPTSAHIRSPDVAIALLLRSAKTYSAIQITQDGNNSSVAIKRLAKYCATEYRQAVSSSAQFWA